MRRSFRGVLIERALKILGVVKRTTHERANRRKIRQIMKKGKYLYQLPFSKFFKNIKLAVLDDMIYYIINQDQAKNPNKVIYFHGGAYLNQPLLFHWRFIQKIAKNTNTEIWVPIYPKIPLYTAKEAYERLIKLYQLLISTYPNNEIILIGDSSGGGLVLGLAQKLKNFNLKQPRDLIMISPWLDISMTNPLIKDLEPYDQMLNPNGLKVCGDYWRGEYDAKDPFVSPLYGELTGLGKITIFIGTYDILYADALSLLDRAKREGINIDFYPYEYMPHDFPLFPVPEVQEALDTIIRIVNNYNKGKEDDSEV